MRNILLKKYGLIKMLDLSKNYSIGNSSLDGDMSLIQSLVKLYHEDDQAAFLLAKQYYLFAISSYWYSYQNFIKRIDVDYIMSLKHGKQEFTVDHAKEIIDYVEKIIGTRIYMILSGNGGILMYLWEKCKFFLNNEYSFWIIDEINSLLDKSSDYISILQNNLEDDQLHVTSLIERLDENFSIKNSTEALLLIANKYCISQNELSPLNTPNYDPQFIKENICPIYSENGYFSYNTYLYALFNDIFLVGIPNVYSVFDGVLACPEAFYKHDISHIKAIYIPKTGLGVVSDIYEHIIFNKNLSKTMKEELIHTLFFWIHEPNDVFNVKNGAFSNMDSFIASYRRDPLEFYEKYNIFYINLDSQLVEEFIDYNGVIPEDREIFDKISTEYDYPISDSIRNVVSENIFFSDEQIERDSDWIEAKCRKLFICFCLCNMRLIRYIADNYYPN